MKIENVLRCLCVAAGFSFALLIIPLFFDKSPPIAPSGDKIALSIRNAGENDSVAVAPQTAPEAQRVEVAAPNLVSQAQELKMLLETEKEHSAKLMSNIEDKRQETDLLKSEINRLKLELGKFSQQSLLARSDFSELEDTISSPGNEISKEQLRNVLVDLALKWPIEWARVSRFDLQKIGVSAVRFEEDSEAIREEWRLYEKTTLDDEKTRSAFWRSNREKIVHRKDDFLSNLRELQGDQVDFLEL